MKNLTAAFFLLTVGIACASNSVIKALPFYGVLPATPRGTWSTNLNLFFKTDVVSNPNLVWVSTDTSQGGFLMELLPRNAPKTVENFLSYVNDGAYENMLIHRSVPGFIIQTGGYTDGGTLQDWNTPIPIANTIVPSEASNGLSNIRGTISMALVGSDSNASNSASDQWFINLNNNASILDKTNINSIQIQDRQGYYTYRYTNGQLLKSQYDYTYIRTNQPYWTPLYTNNPPFTVFARVLGNGMQTVDAIASLPVKDIGAPFNALPFLSNNPIISNLVTIKRVATIPYFAFSSDSDAFPADIDSNGNLVVTFKHYPTNYPIAGVHVNVTATDTNGLNPAGLNNAFSASTNDASIIIIPNTLGSQTITFPQIAEQSLSNNASTFTTNFVTNGSNVTIGSISTNSSSITTFTIPQFPYSSANVPVLLQIISGPIRVSSNPRQTNGILSGTEFILTNTGTVTLKASTYSSTNPVNLGYTLGGTPLVNYYYKGAPIVTSTFVVKQFGQKISDFIPFLTQPTFGDPSLQIQIPTSDSGLPVTVSILSGPAAFNSKNESVSFTGAGTVTMVAKQAGDATHAAQTLTNTFVIGQASQFISFPQSTTNLSVGQTISLTATSSSSLPVSYSLVGGPATLTGGSLKITGPGTVSVVASQVGNSNYLAATPITNNYTTRSNQTISAFGIITNRPYSTNPQTIIVPSSTSKLPIVLSVKSGPASILTSNSISLTGVGTVTLAADQSGNTNFFAAPQITKSFVVAKASQNLTPFAGIPAKLTNGMAPFTVTIPSASSGLTPVLLRASGAGFANNNSVTITNAGTLTLTATNAGNSNYLATSLTTNIPVALGNQSITFPGTNSACQVGLTYTLQATASSGLPVSYSLLPANTTNATLTGTNLFIRSFTTNRISVVAKQAGNSGYNAATNVTNFFTIIPNQGGGSFGGSINTYYGSLTIGNGATWTSNSLITVNGNANSTLLIGTNSYLFSNGVITLTANTNGGNSTLYQGHQLNYLGSTYTLDSNGALVLNSGISQLALSNAPSTNSTNNNTPPGGGPLPPGNVNFGP